MGPTSAGYSLLSSSAVVMASSAATAIYFLHPDSSVATFSERATVSFLMWKAREYVSHVFSERRKTLASSVGGCYSYSRGVQTERLLREQKHNFGACLSRQRYLPTNPKKTRVQNWTDLGSKFRFLSWHSRLFGLDGRCSGWPGESALQLVTTGMGYGSVGTRASATDPQLRYLECFELEGCSA